MTIGKMIVDQMIVGQMTIGKMIVDQIAVGQMTIGQMTFGQITREPQKLFLTFAAIRRQTKARNWIRSLSFDAEELALKTVWNRFGTGLEPVWNWFGTGF